VPHKGLLIITPVKSLVTQRNHYFGAVIYNHEQSRSFARLVNNMFGTFWPDNINRIQSTPDRDNFNLQGKLKTV